MRILKYGLLVVLISTLSYGMDKNSADKNLNDLSESLMLGWETAMAACPSRANLSFSISMFDRLYSDLVLHQQGYRSSEQFSVYVEAFLGAVIAVCKRISDHKCQGPADPFASIPVDRLEGLREKLLAFSVDSMTTVLGELSTA